MHIMDKKVKGITCNSKKVKDGFVFVAIKGESIDGNDFIEESIENGAVIIYTNKDISDDRVSIIKVDDPRKELAKLLNEFYGYPTEDLTIIGVTGTNGKTTTTHIIESIFRKAGYKTALIGTLGVKINDQYESSVLTTSDSTLTTPDSEKLYGLFNEFKERNVEVVIMEVSSHGLKFHRTYGVDFDVAIHTNIEIDHLDFHKSFENYLKTKKMLFDSLRRNRLAILNIDDENATKLLEGNRNVLTLTYGLNSKSSITASSINVQETLDFTVCLQRNISTYNGKVYEPQEFNISMNLSGLYNVYNSLAAISCALYFGIDIDVIQKALKEVKDISRRFEKIYEKDYTVIDDFCHNPASYQAVLDTVRGLNYNKLIIVNAIRGNRGIEINNHNASVFSAWHHTLNYPRVILSLSKDVVEEKDGVKNEELEQYRNMFNNNSIEYEVYENLNDSIKQSIKYASKGDIILLLGPQGMNKGKETFYRLLKDS
ncbi:Mur ligase family protein [Clostridium sp. D2Q-11]|uniref:Mur ligase family protein n=1 Tax=Anaeromonas frigoriresistens TaxID=2683708 RepID=A0A942Z7Y9_9FIRM|nr:Mur ligase family protein [Anaeromonas frigoriresistens]MBS4539227.1 Mur ligase family protein [Anaeromonas frigoriresistens]